MKIAVCVKCVPDSSAHTRIDPQTKRLDRSGEAALNPFDVNAVEEALRLREAAGEAEVVVISLGPERALEPMRKALAMGADRLRRPLVSQVADLTVKDGSVTAKRQTEFGYDVIEAPLPAVVAVSDAINEPRYPSLKGIMGAKSKPQETLSLGDLGVAADEAGEAGSRTTVLALGEPPARGDTVKIEDDGSAPQKILEFLLEKKAL